MVTFMLPLTMKKLKYYVDNNGRSTFEKWFNELNNYAAAKITKEIYKLELGNFSNVEGVGGGVFEQKINFGPGYRVYFGKENMEIIILLCGGSKKDQSTDIKNAKAYWQDYKIRKR